MDPLLPRLETDERRRRGRLLFRHNKIPLRMVVPNFFTVLSLCAGLTAIRMAIEAHLEADTGAPRQFTLDDLAESADRLEQVAIVELGPARHMLKVVAAEKFGFGLLERSREYALQPIVGESLHVAPPARLVVADRLRSLRCRDRDRD